MSLSSVEGLIHLEELIDRRQSLVAGYCQGAVVILHAKLLN